MLRAVRSLAIAVAAIVVVAVIALYVALRASLPELDGRVEVAGIDGSVTIERDAAGTATITAADRASLAFGTGYAHAQDRFFQMDLLRRQSAGRLAELFGPAVLPFDRGNRLHRFGARAAEVIAATEPEARSILEAYARGVNAGLEGLGARPPEYLLLNQSPEAWRAEHTVLALYSMFLTLNDARAERDIARGFAALALPDAYFDWLYPAGSSWDAPVDDEPGQYAETPIPGPDAIDLRELPLADSELHANLGKLWSREGGLPGSNNWAVAGRLTADGRALVANDMHLGIDAPNIWYRARLVQTAGVRRDVSGVMLPGTPFVATGSNGQVAWAFTNSYGDWTDAVLLKPAPTGDGYLTPDGEQAFEHHAETLVASDGTRETLEVRETVWGPVLDDVTYPGGEVAVSWIAHHVRAANVRHLELETAASVEEALATASRLGIPPQNFVAGDAAGNIGWTIGGQMQRRGSAPSERPSDWSDGAGWQGWLDGESYPRIVNPPEGRIWTANSRVVSGERLALVGDGGYDLGARGMQIRDALRAGDDFDARDMLAIHLDDRALFLERWRTLLLELLDDAAVAERPDRRAFRDLVRDWTPRASVDSVGYRLVRGFRREAERRVFDMLTLPIINQYGEDVPRRISNQFEAPLWQAVTERPAHLLSAAHEDWRSFLLAAVDANLDYFASEFDDGLESRTWGEYNTGRFRHPLSRAVPALGRWLDLPATALPGDNDMPRVQGPTFGASERFAVAPGNEAGGYLHMPGGASGHPLSPYRLAGHDDWVTGAPSAFLPGPAANRLELVPRR